MNKRMSLLLMMLASFSTSLMAQKAAVKTNLFYGVYTQTPNIGLELGLGKKTTLEIAGGYNPWNLKGTADRNKKLVHWLGQAEYRYWFCQKFNGHFLGVHALGAEYNISQHRLPLLFGKDSDRFRYQGWAVGAGVAYGYQFILGQRWNIELSAGVGYARLHYDKYECKTCGEKLGFERRNYFGPTKAAVSIVYIIEDRKKPTMIK